jgi:hypothetical protein
MGEGGSDQRPPDYEHQMRASTGFHRFGSVCKSALNVKYYSVLYCFVEIVEWKLAPYIVIIIWKIKRTKNYSYIYLLSKLEFV